MALHTFLADELDKDSLQIAYDLFQKKPVEAKRAKQALDNLVSYGIHLAPDAAFEKNVVKPMFAPVKHDPKETDEAFRDLLAPQPAHGLTSAVQGKFLDLFKSKVLPVILQLLLGLI